MAINRTFSHFNQQPLRQADLLKIWEQKHPDGKNKEKIMPLPRSYVETRWLSLLPSADTLIYLFEILQEYFEKEASKIKAKGKRKKTNESENEKSEQKENEDSIIFLNNFFSKKESKIWLEMITTFFFELHSTVKKIQGKEATIMTGVTLAFKLRSKAKQMMNGNYYFENNDAVSNDDFNILIATFHEYMEKWLKQFEEFTVLEWASLRKPINLRQVCMSIMFLKRNGCSFEYDFNDLSPVYKELEWINEKFENSFWNENNTRTVDRWNDVIEFAKGRHFQFIHIKSLVECILTLSPSNAICETIFSEIKFFWRDEKSNLGFNTLQVFVKARHNITTDLRAFKMMVREDEALIEKIRKKRVNKKETIKYRQQEILQIMSK